MRLESSLDVLEQIKRGVNHECSVSLTNMWPDVLCIKVAFGGILRGHEFQRGYSRAYLRDAVADVHIPEVIDHANHYVRQTLVELENRIK